MLKITGKTNKTISMSNIVKSQIKGDSTSLKIDNLYLSQKGNLHLECLDADGNLFEIELETAQYPTITPKPKITGGSEDEC